MNRNVTSEVNFLFEDFKRLNEANDKRLIAKATRMWIEDNPKIHILNYWFYRWFTNELELYILENAGDVNG